jgi:hypothetical protein
MGMDVDQARYHQEAMRFDHLQRGMERGPIPSLGSLDSLGANDSDFSGIDEHIRDAVES